MTMLKKKILNSNPLLFLSMLSIVIIVFLTNTVNAKAEGTNTYTLPYSFEDYRSNNSLFPEGFEVTVLSDFVNSNFYRANVGSINFNANTCVLVPFVDTINNTVYIYLLSEGVFSDTSSVSSIYSTECYYNFVLDYSCFRLRYNIDSAGNLTYADVSNAYHNNTAVSIFGGSISREFGSTGLYYQNNYPFFVESEVFDTLDNLVLVPNTPVWNEEEAFEDFVDGLDITSTISNNIDPALNDLQNQKGFFDNLINNLSNFFNKLNGWINNAFSFLASNIKNFFGPFLRNIQNRINTFFESFEDFKDKWSKFFQIIASIYNLGLKNGEFDLPTLVVGLLVPNVDQLSSIIRSSVLGAIVFSLSSFSANTISFVQSWFNTTPVYIYHIPDFTFHGQTISGLYFDFSWYSTYKPYGDAIISFWLVIHYGMFLLRFVPRFLRSAGSGYSEGSDIVDYYDHPDRDDGSYYFENGMRAPSMFDFM